MREIKVVKTETLGKTSVRNLPDALAVNEIVIAAAWQDGGEVKIFSFAGHENEIFKQIDNYTLSINATEDDFVAYIKRNWDLEEIRNAVFPPLN